MTVRWLSGCGEFPDRGQVKIVKPILHGTNLTGEKRALYPMNAGLATARQCKPAWRMTSRGP